MQHGVVPVLTLLAILSVLLPVAARHWDPVHGEHLDKTWHEEPQTFYVDQWGHHTPMNGNGNSGWGRRLLDSLPFLRKRTKQDPKTPIAPKDAIKQLAKKVGIKVTPAKPPRALLSATSTQDHIDVIVVDKHNGCKGCHHHHHCGYNCWGRKMLAAIGL